MQSENWTGGSLVRLAASRMEKRRLGEGGESPEPEAALPGQPIALPALPAEPITPAVFSAPAPVQADHAPHVSVKAVPRLREYLAAYVEGELDASDGEIVREHLRICAECEGYVDGLRAGRGAKFRALAAANALLARYEREEATPRALPPVPSALPTAAAVRSRRPMLAFACASTCVALFICVTAVPLFQQIRELRSHVGKLQQNNSSLRQEAEDGRLVSSQLTNLKQETDNLRRRYNAAQSTLNRMSVDVAGMHTQERPSVPPAAPMRVIPVPMREAAQPANAIMDGASMVTVDSSGRVRGLPSVSEELTRYTTNAMKTGKLPMPPISKFGPSGSGFAATGGTGTIMEAEKPTLRWRPIENGAPYAVTVFDGTGAIIARGQNILGNDWTVNSPLQRGKAYVWEVTARGVTGPGGQMMKRSGKFGVLEQAELDAVNRVRNAHADSNLLVGLACANAGLLESAAKEFQLLAEANPGCPIVQKLSRQLDRWR